MAIHRNLTGADLHEPKGADTALAGQIYVSNGAGSGSWVAAGSVITNSAWSTGDVKSTFKNVVDTGWLFFTYNGTIGDSSSGANVRANADCEALFKLWWNTQSGLAVSGGRGASADLDWAAHKTIAMPNMLSRALGVAGNGDGGNKPLGFTEGTSTITMIQNNMPAIQLAVSVSGSVSGSLVSGQTNICYQPTVVGLQGGGGSIAVVGSSGSVTVSGTLSGSMNGATATLGNATPMNIVQPTAYLNLMVKL